MKKVLIGSRAAFEHFPCEYYRNVSKSDYDYLVDLSPEDFAELKKEKIVNSSGPRSEFHNTSDNKGLRQIYLNAAGSVARLSDLYTLKLSHCFWNIHWQKTMADILFFQQNGVELNDELFHTLYNGWITLHGAKQSYLNRSNDEFFNDAVERVYPHDSIHYAIAYYDEPLYQRCKVDKSRAMLSYDLFLQLNDGDKIRLCREEIYATALERFLIPRNFQLAPRVAYNGACRLLLTSMTKGWFTAYIAKNWKILYKPDDGYDFVHIFKERINEYVGR